MKFYPVLFSLFLMLRLNYFYRDSVLEILLNLALMGSICFIKMLEYRLVKKRWRRLVAETRNSQPPVIGVDADDIEIARLEKVTSLAHLPAVDNVSTYFSALDLDLDKMDG